MDALGNHTFLPLEQCGFLQRHQQWINVDSGQYISPWMLTGSKQIICIVHQQTLGSSIV
jgi:hypothetical protein